MGSPPPAVRVRGYHSRKICENSDAKSCILVTTCCEISCFLKTTAKKLGGDQYIVGPPNLKVGGPVSPGPYGCCAYDRRAFHFYVTTMSRFFMHMPLSLNTVILYRPKKSLMFSVRAGCLTLLEILEIYWNYFSSWKSSGNLLNLL